MTTRTLLLNDDAKYNPDSGVDHFQRSSAGSTGRGIKSILSGEVWEVDVYASVRQSTAAAGTISSWKLTGIFYGTAGPIANLSGSVVSASFGGGVSLLSTAPTLSVSGDTIQFLFTTTDATVWTVGFEYRVARLLF